MNISKTFTTLASPITLSLHETVIHLQDYIVNTNEIVSISAPPGIEIWENKKTGVLCLEIINQELLQQVSTLDILLQDNSTYSIILLQSKKIVHTIRFFASPNTRSVQIAGDFNSWNPKDYNFNYVNGAWQFLLEIEPGNYSYQLIVDGNWINDPLNLEVLENGYGGYNSLLRVPFQSANHEISLETEKIFNDNIVLKINGDITNYLVMWQNQVINDIFTFQHLEKLLITIPNFTKDSQRSFIRVYAFDSISVSNDILIPLEYGNVIKDSKYLTKEDKEAQVMYFVLLDRFYNGNSANNKPIKDTEIHAKLNFYGGDICGVSKKIQDGYFTKLGINTIWISPIVRNPDKPCVKEGKKSAGYHGYWPVESDVIDPRFGNDTELHDLIEIAHNHGINVILDYVANHLHEDNPIIKNNPTWKTPLILPDGSKNIGRWEDQRFTTWFEEFLPTLDYDKPEVVEKMTDIAVNWIKKYNLDGFLHDATKHISTDFWRTLTLKLKKEVSIPQQKRLYQIGETFGGREMLKSYINSGIHDGQFSFNLYYETRSAFLYEDVHFEKLCTCLKQELHSFGYNHMLGNISGNHDMPRFISYAGEDLWMNQNAEHEGWNRHIIVKNPKGYKKLSMLLAFNATIPGIPVIYYGDEIGMPGGGDPDNRRPMKFFGLNEFEQKTLKDTQKLVNLRTHFLPLIYGDFTFLMIEKQILIYKRSYFEEHAFVIFNKSANKNTITFKMDNYLDIKLLQSLHKNKFSISGNIISIELDGYSYDIIYSHKYASDLKENKSEYYIS